MAESHVCRSVSDPKKKAYLSWINALSAVYATPTNFTDFGALEKNGYLNAIAEQMYKRSHSEKDDVVDSLLSDWYGEEFLAGCTRDANNGCPCELEFHTATIVALLLNLAVTHDNDPQYVNVCLTLPLSSQEEIMKTCKFLATETGSKRMPPSEADWKAFLYSPHQLAYAETPVTTRRPLQSQRVIAPPTTPENGRSNERSRSAAHASPVLEALSSPVVHNSAKIREKMREVRWLKKELCEKNHLYEIQSMELVELKKKLEDAGAEAVSLRKKDGQWRKSMWDLQSHEEQFAAKDATIRGLESRIARLTEELEEAKTSIGQFDGMEKERENLYREVHSLTTERDNLKIVIGASNSNAQRASVHLEAAMKKHKEEMENLVERNGVLLLEVRNTRDLQDEIHCRKEEAISLNREVTALKERVFQMSTAHKEEKEKLLREIAKLQAQIADLINERNRFASESQRLVKEKDVVVAEKQALLNERDRLTVGNASLVNERDRLTVDNTRLVNERDHLRTVHQSSVSERDRLLLENMSIISERDRFHAANQLLVSERDHLAAENRNLAMERDHLAAENRNLAMERDHLATENHKQDGRYLRVTSLKRSRRPSTRSGNSVCTFGASSMASDTTNPKVLNNEDEDVVMMQTAVEHHGGGPAILDLVIPAPPDDHPITPYVTPAPRSNFKMPAVPNQDLVKELDFVEDEENWNNSGVIKTLTEPGEGTPRWGDRLSQLHDRNRKMPPHLKSSYPVETQLLPQAVNVEELKTASNYEPPTSALKAMKTTQTPKSDAKAKKPKTDGSAKSPARGLRAFLKTTKTNASGSKANGAATLSEETTSSTVNTASSFPKAVKLEIPITPAKKSRPAFFPKKTTNKSEGITFTKSTMIPKRKD